MKELPAGHSIGYGNTYVTTAKERVALVPVGYSDGFRRGPTNPGFVLIQGTRCPIRGRVSMEKTVVSVQHLPKPVHIGDEVVLLGQVWIHSTSASLTDTLSLSCTRACAARLRVTQLRPPS